MSKELFFYHHSVTWIWVPGVKSCRHGRHCEWRRPAVGLHQDTLYRGCGGRYGPQGGLQRGDTVELHSGETAHESWGVISLYQHRINLTRFWKTTAENSSVFICVKREKLFCPLLSSAFLQYYYTSQTNIQLQKEKNIPPEVFISTQSKHNVITMQIN